MTVLRFARAEDAEAMAAIYAYYVEKTTITFEYAAPDTAEMGRRLAEVQQDLPWLVAEVDGTVGGYAYAHHFHERPAYQWSAEVSVYMARDLQRQGLGRMLYRAVLHMLQAQGYHTAFALVTHPNPASEQFHMALGFKPVGVLHRAGCKLGKWLDVSYWEYQLADGLPENPPPPVSISSLPETRLLEIFCGL